MLAGLTARPPTYEGYSKPTEARLKQSVAEQSTTTPNPIKWSVSELGEPIWASQFENLSSGHMQTAQAQISLCIQRSL